MSFPPFYKDIAKNANDLLNKGYPIGDNFSWKVDLDTTSSNGVQFTPFIQKSLKDGDLSGELKSKFSCCDYSFTTSGNLRNDLSVEISGVKFNRGLRHAITLSTTSNQLLEKLKVKPTVEFRSEYVNFTGSFEQPLTWATRYVVGDDPLKPKEPSKLLLSAITGHHSCGFAAGGEIDIAPQSREVKGFNTITSYTTSDLEVAGFSKTKIGANTVIGANFYHKLNRWLESVSSEVQYDLSAKSSPVLAFGGLLRPDVLTSIKSRINTKGLFGFSLTQKWGGPFTFTVAGELNLLQLKTNDAAQFSIKISIK